MNQCNICMESKDHYYKICTCTSSQICNDCLREMNRHKSYTCPICRRNLNLAEMFHKKKYCYAVSSNLTLFTLIILMECVIPVLYFINNETIDKYETNDFILNWGGKRKVLIPSIFISVFIIQPINLIIHNYTLNISLDECIIRNKVLIKNIMIYNSLVNIILFPINTRKVGQLYFILVIFLVFWTIFISGLFIVVFINIKYAINYFSRINFTSRRIVPIIRIIHPRSENNSDESNDESDDSLDDINSDDIETDINGATEQDLQTHYADFHYVIQEMVNNDLLQETRL